MRLIPAAVLAAAVCVLAACSSSSSDDPSSSSPPPTSAAVTSTAPTTAPVVTTPASTTAAPTPTPTPTSTTRSTPAPSTTTARLSAPAFTTTCRSLRVDVLKGGAIRGMEIAAMQFTNEGTSTCTITGVPTATLLRNGAVVGKPSKAGTATIRPFTVRPGAYGEALLRDFSTCNAPLSDQLRLQGPSRNGTAGKTVTQPIKLRACTLQVAPVGEPS